MIFGVKYTFEGNSVKWLYIVAHVIKVALFVAFIYASVEPFTLFIDHWQAFLNDVAKIDLYFMLWKLLWIFGLYVLTIVIEAIIAFGIIIPSARKIIQNKFRRRMW